MTGAASSQFLGANSAAASPDLPGGEHRRPVALWHTCFQPGSLRHLRSLDLILRCLPMRIGLKTLAMLSIRLPCCAR